MFAPRDRAYFELFEEAGQNIQQAADLLDELLSGYPDSRDLAQEILDCEHTGDRITHDIIGRLNHDVRHADRPRGHPRARLGARRHRRLHRGGRRLPRPLQDRGADGPGDQARPRAEGRRRQICEAIPRLRGFRDISHYTVEINRLENEGDRITREAVASLFDGGIDPMVVIRWKDLFERLEAAIDAAEQVANILEGIVIKNS